MISAIFIFIVATTATFLVLESIRSPKPATMQSVTFLNKPIRVIANVVGKSIDYKDRLVNGISREFNLYFYLWPFYKVYKYEITYNKRVMPSQIKDGDKVLWITGKDNDKEEKSGELVISRTRITNYLKYRVDYPLVNLQLDTKELVDIDIFTNNVIEIFDANKALYDIDDYLQFAFNTISSALRGIVANCSVIELNKFRSEEKEGENKSSFNALMQCVNFGTANHPGLNQFGMRLCKSSFIDFAPSGENAKALLNAYSQVPIAEQAGLAALAKQQGETKAYLNRTDAIISQERKKRLEIGTARLVDPNKKDGAIDLVPDADVKASTDATKELAKLRGTLVMDTSNFTKMLNINPSQKSEVNIDPTEKEGGKS